MGKYREYSEYKDSGVGWLGEIPSHWRLEKAKYLFDRKQRPVRGEDGVVTAFRDGEVTLRSNRREAGFTNSLKEIGYQGVRVGDLLIHAMDGFAGAIGVSDSDGKCSPVCSVCVPAGRYGVHAKYYGRLLRHMALTGFVTALAKGIRERSTEFRFNEFKELALALPPEDEQGQIANFLDRETTKIDRLIAKQEALIELLKEKRQAVISHAVTKGLDPDASMKDSGVEWLGEIPAHWTRTRVKFLTKGIIDGPHFSPKYVDDGVMFISARNIKVEGWSFGDAKYISEEDYVEFSKRVLPEVGDVLLTKGGTTGVARAVDFADRFQVWVHVAVLKTLKNEVVPEYLAYALNAKSGYDQSQLHTRGATNNDLGLTRIANIFLARPSYTEQSVIVDYLDKATQRFDRLIKHIEEQIALHKERRTTLISAAVTGKIDVRED